jgi:hypothetical protein
VQWSICVPLYAPLMALLINLFYAHVYLLVCALEKEVTNARSRWSEAWSRAQLRLVADPPLRAKRQALDRQFPRQKSRRFWNSFWETWRRLGLGQGG